MHEECLTNRYLEGARNAAMQADRRPPMNPRSLEQQRLEQQWAAEALRSARWHAPAAVAAAPAFAAVASGPYPALAAAPYPALAAGAARSAGDGGGRGDGYGGAYSRHADRGEYRDSGGLGRGAFGSNGVSGSGSRGGGGGGGGYQALGRAEYDSDRGDLQVELDIDDAPMDEGLYQDEGRYGGAPAPVRAFTLINSSDVHACVIELSRRVVCEAYEALPRNLALECSRPELEGGNRLNDVNKQQRVGQLNKAGKIQDRPWTCSLRFGNSNHIKDRCFNVPKN